MVQVIFSLAQITSNRVVDTICDPVSHHDMYIYGSQVGSIIFINKDKENCILVKKSSTKNGSIKLTQRI